MKRSLCLAVALIVASAGLIVGAGQSDAAPQLPRIGITGDTMGTFGDHSYCRGVLHVGLTAAPSKRGVVRVTLTSSGFIGNGPSWKRKPVCKLLIGTVHTSVEAYAKWNFFNADFGPRRGQNVNGQFDVPAGGQVKVPTLCGMFLGWRYLRSVCHAVGVAVGDDDGGVVQEPVEDAGGGGVFGEESSPLFEGPVAGDRE